MGRRDLPDMYAGAWRHSTWEWVQTYQANPDLIVVLHISCLQCFFAVILCCIKYISLYLQLALQIWHYQTRVYCLNKSCERLIKINFVQTLRYVLAYFLAYFKHCMYRAHFMQLLTNSVFGNILILMLLEIWSKISFLVHRSEFVAYIVVANLHTLLLIHQTKLKRYSLSWYVSFCTIIIAVKFISINVLQVF